MFRFFKQLMVLLFLFSGFLLSGCQPITPTVEPIVNLTPEPVGTEEITSTRTLTASNSLLDLLPTATPITASITLVLPTATPTLEALPTVVVEQPITATETTVTIGTPTIITPTVEEVLPLPTDTRVAKPLVKALNSINVRNGPGTDYLAVNALAQNAQAEIVGRNLDTSWWQVTLTDGTTGWVYAPLVEVIGDSSTIALVDTPPLPPTAPPTATAILTLLASAPDKNTPVPSIPVSTPTIAQPESTPTSAEPVVVAPEGPTFRVIEKRLWDVFENGGTLDGESVKCGEKRQLVVVVVDKNGVRLNGVAVQEQYGAREILVTGSQGKGDGAVEYILGSGQDVAVIRDADGREAISEVATGLVTRPDVIPFDLLIAGRYCTDDASCASFVATAGCWGHYSWTVIFQRNY